MRRLLMCIGKFGFEGIVAVIVDGVEASLDLQAVLACGFIFIIAIGLLVSIL